MCAAATVTVERKCPIIPSKNLFFKQLTKVKLSDDNAQQDISDHFSHATQKLACSNKHGCILAAFGSSFIVMRSDDVWSAQVYAESSNIKTVDLAQIPHIAIQNNCLGSIPSLISISNGEEFLAVDTNKNGHSFVVIFKLLSFLQQKGNCKPFCEIRGSIKPNSKISSICWNPGENLNNMVAISSSDGSLILVKIIRENTIENWVLNDGVQTICWSPKGKQLVVGKTDGNLSQLKLDLSEAKKIPGPGGCVPTSIFWSSTTQFVVVFDSKSEISVMVVDAVKGAVHCTNYDDVFMSDTVSYSTRCFFLPFVEWKCIIALTNSSSDVVLFGRTSDLDPWSLLDIPDNKRAILPIDNYSLGAAVYLGHRHNVVVSDSEQYGPMPVLYLLSQSGILFSFMLINSDPGALNLVAAVTDPIPESIFASQNQTQAIPQSIAAPIIAPSAVPLPTVPLPSFSMPTIPSPSPGNTLKSPQVTASSSSTLHGLLSSVVTAPTPSPQVKPLQQQGLPTAKELEQVKSILTERLQETTSLSDEAQEYQNLLIDVQKFEQRFSNFKDMQAVELAKVQQKLETAQKYFDDNIIGNLIAAENFVKDIEDTTAAQKEEIEILKEKILYQFSNLEYAKSVLEQTKDLRYIHLLRSQPMNPATHAKFKKIEKLHYYVQNQITEAERYFYYNKTEELLPKSQQLTAAHCIYQTIANHSRIARRLSEEVEKLRGALKLGESSQSTKNWFGPESELVDSKKDVLDVSFDTQINKSPKSNTKRDTISLEDLLSGIREVKLNSDDESSKPVLISRKKLSTLLHKVENPVEIECYDLDPGITIDFASLSDAIKDIEKKEVIDIEGGGDRYKLSLGERRDTVQSQLSKISTSQTGTLNSNQQSVSFSVPSDQRDAHQQPVSFFSTPTKDDTLQSGDIKLTGTVHPLPAFTSSTPIKPFGSIVGSTPNITPMKFSAFAPADSVTAVKAFSFKPESSSLGIKSSVSDSSSTPSESAKTSPKPSGSIFGGNLTAVPSLTSITGFTATTLPSPSVFGGNSALFGQIKSTNVTTPPSSSTSIILGGAPPSVSIKSTPTPPIASSSSSSSTSEEGNAEQKPTSTQPFSMLSTPISQSNVGLWGISSGSFTGQTPEQKPSVTSPPAAVIKTPSPIASFLTSPTIGSVSSIGGSPREKEPTPPTTVQQKPGIASSTFSIITPTPIPITSFAQSSTPLGKSEASETSATTTSELLFTGVPPNKSIFSSGTSITVPTPPTQVSTSVSGTTLPTTFLSSPPTTPVTSTTSIFGSAPTTSLNTSGLFGSSSLFTSPPISLSSASTTSVFGGSLTTPVTTTVTTAAPSFTTSGLFSSTSSKSIFGGGSTTVITTATATPSSTSIFSTTQPQSQTTSLFSSLTSTATTTAVTSLPATSTISPSGLFSTPASSPSIFGGATFGSTVPASTVAATTAASIFGTPSASIFGSPFGGNVTTTTPSSPFADQANQNVQSPFGGTTSASTMSPFGNTTTVAPNQSPFAPANTTSAASIFGGVGNTSVTSPFGGITSSTQIASPTSPFGPSTISSTPASPFGSANTTSTPATSIFGQSQPASVFGGGATSTTSVFGGTGAFGSPTPQQNTASSVFGQSPASSVFGGKPTFGGSPAFGSAFGSPTAQQPSTGSIFGASSFGSTSPQPESIFGSSSFGLGAKPSSDGANRNVFGGSNTYGSSPSPGIFGGTSGTAQLGSGATLSPVAGAFSSGGAGVAQTGFGAAAVKPAVGGFGNSPTFGSAPAFGSTPFGPAFGSTGSPTSTFTSNAGTGSIFGGGTQQSGPTFGALAQSSTQSAFGGFSTPQATVFGQQQQQQQQPPPPSFGGGTSFSSWR